MLTEPSSKSLFRQTACGHVFEKGALLKYKERGKSNCPSCRAPDALPLELFVTTALLKGQKPSSRSSTSSSSPHPLECGLCGDDLMRLPVTLPCGDSYCLRCILSHFHNTVELERKAEELRSGRGRQKVHPKICPRRSCGIDCSSFFSKLRVSVELRQRVAAARVAKGEDAERAEDVLLALDFAAPTPAEVLSKALLEVKQVLRERVGAGVEPRLIDSELERHLDENDFKVLAAAIAVERQLNAEERVWKNISRERAAAAEVEVGVAVAAGGGAAEVAEVEVLPESLAAASAAASRPAARRQGPREGAAASVAVASSAAAAAPVASALAASTSARAAVVASVPPEAARPTRAATMLAADAAVAIPVVDGPRGAAVAAGPVGRGRKRKQERRGCFSSSSSLAHSSSSSSSPPSIAAAALREMAAAAAAAATATAAPPPAALSSTSPPGAVKRSRRAIAAPAASPRASKKVFFSSSILHHRSFSLSFSIKISLFPSSSS